MQLTERLWTVYCQAVRVDPKTRGTMMSWAKEMVALTHNLDGIDDSLMEEILKTLEWCEEKLKYEFMSIDDMFKSKGKSKYNDVSFPTSD